MSRTKKIVIDQVNFLKPVYIRFGSVSRPETRVNVKSVTKLEMVGTNFILINHRGTTTWVPMANIMSIQLAEETEDE